MLASPEDRVLVDATEVVIKRSTIAWVQKATWSGYKRRNTLKYEVAISEQTGMPISFSGPFVGSTSDIKIFRSKLKEKMLEFNYLGLADGTYQGEQGVLTVPPRGYKKDTPAQRVNRKAQSSRRIQVENFFGRMKLFRVLKTTYRHNILDHYAIFNVVLQITKMDLMINPLRKIIE